jgi:hypothetical protein
MLCVPQASGAACDVRDSRLGITGFTSGVCCSVAHLYFPKVQLSVILRRGITSKLERKIEDGSTLNDLIPEWQRHQSVFQYSDTGKALEALLACMRSSPKLVMLICKGSKLPKIQNFRSSLISAL